MTAKLWQYAMLFAVLTIVFNIAHLDRIHVWSYNR